MKVLRILMFAFVILLSGCENDSNVDSDSIEARFVPTDVLVKIKGDYTIDKVFEFINHFNHDVENIHSQAYTSELPSDSLQYVLDYLNTKSYTNDGNAWFVNGYLHYQTNVITIFPRLFDITNLAYQKDWLESMKLLKLKEDTKGKSAGCIIYFHVPVGKEKEWEKRFEKYEFVEWAELNYYADINPWP